MKQDGKKRLITSYKNLSEETKKLFHTTYEAGYSHLIQKIVKPDGSTIYVVPLSCEDINYLVKVEVRVDNKLSEEELEKEFFPTPKGEVSDFPENKEEEGDKEESAPFVLMHGEYEDDAKKDATDY